ncbi:SDR family NAD(P)-dependent oxidoreductase [Sporolactobacillus sp. KGMB 08714]|uniref:SDR family NAD(P)-dependent oxidoreductase n=1 Tax=Sporolactobacillus sp. KGMB 08714 TaxID=3064704 RepID=UPI002FBD82CA
MERALVLGATGGIGQAIVAELIARGSHVIAFGRSQQKMKKIFAAYNRQQFSYATGDVFDADTVADAAKDADVIFHCANVNYQEMKNKLLPMGQSVMTAADRLHKKIVVIDGIYVYGHQVAEGNEAHPKHPHTQKGKIRLAYEKLIFSDQWRNAQPLIVRLPDYYGPTSQSAYLQPTLEGLTRHRIAFFIGNLTTRREYIYLPDAAQMIVSLAERDDTSRENWNIPGSGLISGKEIVKIVREITGRRKRAIPLHTWMIALIGLFDPFMREVTEIMYLTKEGFILSGEKYRKRVGPIVRTPFRQGLAQTLRAYKAEDQ